MRIFAKELVALQPDVLMGHTTGVVAALQREAKSIPIVFVIVSDPVGSGFVESLPRPGGNITGFINIEASLSGKWIEMLKEIVPRITRAALMFNPATAPYIAFYQQPFEAAARSSGIVEALRPGAEDRQGTRHRYSGDAARPRRRGDRMMSPIGTKRTWPDVGLESVMRTVADID
jgi:putative tryptophan/tyrosine transport system substrate-binding protein